MNELAGMPLDHVAVVTRSIRETAPLYELITGARCSRIEDLPDQNARVAFIGMVELVEPVGSDNGIARFLERRGPSLHHLAYRVRDLGKTLDRLQATGVRLIDSVPRQGARGHEVAFLHPSAGGGVLIELVALSEP